MKTIYPVSFIRQRPLLGLTALLLVFAAILALTLAGTGPAGAQDNSLSVSITASPLNPQAEERVDFSVTISNPPAGETPSYHWELHSGNEKWMTAGRRSTFSFVSANPGSTTFRVKVSYDTGDSATSEPLTIEWTEREGQTPIPSQPDPTPEPTAAPTPGPTATPTPEPTATPTPPPAPSVSSVAVSSDAGSDDTYAKGDVIAVTVTFREAVNVTGAPQLAIDMDPANWGTKWTAYSDGSGTASLTFTHTVVEPNVSTQGIAVLADTLKLNGGSIKSVSSQANADLSHAGLGHDPSHKVDWRQSAPAPTSTPAPAPTSTPAPEPTPAPTPPPGLAVVALAVVSDAGGDNTYTMSDVIRIGLAFSEPVDVTGRPSLAIDMDPADWGTKWATYAGGSGTASLTFTHTVVEPNLSTQGIAVLADTLKLNGGSIKSVSSQADADLSHAGLNHDASHKVDWQQSPCIPEAPSSVSGLGIERGMVVTWTMPEGNPASCVATGFRITLTKNAQVAQYDIADPSARFHHIAFLSPGEYDVSVYVTYGEQRAEIESQPEVAYSTQVPDDCSITLSLVATGAHEVTGKWTNAANGDHGCESGGVYVDWKKKTAADWASTYRVPNEQEELKQFIFGNMDHGVYEFRVRAIDARGMGIAEPDDAWMETSATAEVTLKGGPTGLSVSVPDAWEEVKTATVSWSPPRGFEHAEYAVRYRLANTSALSSFSSSTDWVEDHTVTECTHTVSGLAGGQPYWIEVGSRNATDTNPLIASDPGIDKTYANGDKILVRLRFDKAVTVTGVPRLKIDLNERSEDTPITGLTAGQKWAYYESGSGTHCLTFAYTVTTGNKTRWIGDTEDKGLAVVANSLELNGGTIQTVEATPQNAGLTHDGLDHDSDHKVDGGLSPDAKSPAVAEAYMWSKPHGFTAAGPAEGGLSLTKDFDGNVTVTLGDLPVLHDRATYNVRYRKSGASAWTTAASSLTASTHTIAGLDHYAVYEVQVQAREGTKVLWSQSATVRAVNDPLQVWFADNTPGLTAVSNEYRIFLGTRTNKSNSSAKCTINGANINCPPGGLSSLRDVQLNGTYTIHATATQGGESAQTPRITGDHTGARTPEVMLVSGGNGEFVVSWKPYANTHNTAVTPGALTGWVIEVKTGAGAWTEQAVVGPAVREYRVTGLTNGNHLVRVRGRTSHQCDDDNNPNTPVATCDERTGMSYEWPVTTAAIKRTLPSAVVNAVVAGAGAGKLKVEWDPPWRGSEVYGYTVRHRETGSTGAWTEQKVYPRNVHRNEGANPRSVTLENLTAGKRYRIEVRAHNVNGDGPWHTATPDGGSLPRGSFGVALSKDFDGNVKATWNALTGAGTVAGYNVRYRKSGVSVWTTATSSLAATATTHTIADLDHYAVYEIQVGARVGTEVLWSQSKTARAVDDPLQAWFVTNTPQFFPAQDADSDDVIFMLAAANKSNVSAKCSIGVGDDPTVNCPPGTLVSLPVNPAGTYTIGAKAKTAGTSAQTPRITGDHTGAYTPTVMLVSGGNGEFVVSWKPYANTHNTAVTPGALTGWVIEVKTGAGAWTEQAVVGPAVREYRVTGLTNGNHLVRVRGRTSHQCDDDNNPNTPVATCDERTGMSYEWPVTTAAIKRTLPSAVVNAVVAGAGAGKLKVEWDPPWRGSEVYGYTVRHRETGSTGAWTEQKVYPRNVHRNEGANPRSVTLENLTAGKRYRIEVRAHNVNGDGPWVVRVKNAPSS